MIKNKVNLFIPNILNPAGTERAVINLANNLSVHNYQVIIWSLHTSDGTPFFEVAEDIVVNHLNIVYPKKYVGKVKSLYLLKKLLNKLDVKDSYVIGTNHVINCLLPFTSLRKYNVIFGCEHLNYDSAVPLTKKIRTFCYSKLDSLIVLTQSDVEQYERYIPSLKTLAIPNEISFYTEEINDYSIKRVLAIGRLELQKGFDIMIDDIGDIMKDFPNWTLTIVGSGTMEEELLDKISKKSIRNIEILPPTKNVEQLYLSSSFYLMTSRNEGFPMVLLEAQATGLSVLAYDCPTGPREIIINNETGFVVNIQDKTEFRNRFKELLINESLRLKLGVNAKNKILRFDRENTFKLWERLFNDFRNIKQLIK